LAVLACVLGLSWLCFTVANRRDFNDDDTQRRRRREWLHKTYRLALFTLFLLYPGVSSSVLAMFTCHDVEGTYYMLSDIRVLCLDARWYRYLPVAVMALLVYPIGIPGLFYALLSRFRHRLRDPTIATSLGFFVCSVQRRYVVVRTGRYAAQVVLDVSAGLLPCLHAYARWSHRFCDLSRLPSAQTTLCQRAR